MAQFLIEEAVFDRLDHAERKARAASLPEGLIGTEELDEAVAEAEPSLHEQLGRRHAALMSQGQES